MPSRPSRPRPNASPQIASAADLLLNGRPGAEGFLFHDGYNQPIHQAAPGLLGLLEGRGAIERWKPAIVRWMDEAGHFFNHLLNELDDEAYTAPIRFEIEERRDRDVPSDVKNRALFDYLRTVTGALERERLADTPGEELTLPSAARDISLNGRWTAYYRRGTGRYAEQHVDLPVNWELIPGIENYGGTIRFTRTVRVPDALYGRAVLLSFAGVDYFADVWVNGHHAGGHEGCFAPFQLDVSGCLDYGGRNVIRVAVTSPNEPSGPGTDVSSGWNDFRPSSSFPNRKTLIKGTLGHHDAKRGGAWSSLTGQDGNTGGVWNDVTVHVRGAVRLAPGVRITTRSLSPAGARTDDHVASVELRFPVESSLDRRVGARLRVDVEPANFDGPRHELRVARTVEPGQSEIVVREDALGPVRPWQLWDQGHPHLYTFRATLEAVGQPADETVIESGFRTLSVTPIGESSGPAGAFVLNGRRVFARGTNLLPTYWLSQYSEEAADRDFPMLRDAGFNAIIVHTLVAPKRLYEHANRAGILVVQILPFQWSYDATPDFVERAARQVRELVDLLWNEPCIVSYDTHNEPDMRVSEGVDNRHMDVQLHRVLREADPYRWATTYSGGNHAYPGQFYELRDDNSFATLPARFEENEFAGERIARHRNMPTEFGIQAMPSLDLFEALLSEERVRAVLRRMRTDPKWRAAGGEPWEQAQETLAAVTDVLGGGDWARALAAFDWRLLRRLGQLEDDIHRLESEAEASGSHPARTEGLLSRRLAVLLLDVLHYGGFKGENFWFGDWRPGRTAAEFAAASQDRQYRLHKDAIESYLNAGVTGPIVGYFSFMFRDSDWQAPTWGVVDASWTPKKAFRAYVESNQPVRVTLPQALRQPVKLRGDPWFGRAGGERGPLVHPWVTAEVIAANDTSEALRDGTIDVCVEDENGRRVGAVRLPVDIDAGTGFSYFDRIPEARLRDDPAAWVVGDEPPGTYYLRASISGPDGRVLSTNSYELAVLDTAFPELLALDPAALQAVLHGRGGAGFHFWAHGQLVHKAEPGVAGLVAGYRHAQRQGVDLWDVVQGEHFFRHLLEELHGLEEADVLVDTVWRIRSEIVSPAEKTAVLMRALERLIEQADRERQTRPARARGRKGQGGRPA